MRILFFIAMFLMASVGVRAQIVLEALAGNQQAHYINYIDKIWIAPQNGTSLILIVLQLITMTKCSTQFP